MKPKNKTKRILLLAACTILFAALLWTLFRAGSDPMQWICDEINARGYSIQPQSLSYEGGASDTTIRSLLNSNEISEAVSASKSSGFPSDIDKRGDVALIMGWLDDASVLTLYIIGDNAGMHIELCFIQSTTGEVKPLS